jgi:hypothetical protein
VKDASHKSASRAAGALGLLAALAVVAAAGLGVAYYRAQNDAQQAEERVREAEERASAAEQRAAQVLEDAHTAAERSREAEAARERALAAAGDAERQARQAAERAEALVDEAGGADARAAAAVAQMRDALERAATAEQQTARYRIAAEEAAAGQRQAEAREAEARRLLAEAQQKGAPVEVPDEADRAESPATLDQWSLWVGEAEEMLSRAITEYQRALDSATQADTALQQAIRDLDADAGPDADVRLGDYRNLRRSSQRAFERSRKSLQEAQQTLARLRLGLER